MNIFRIITGIARAPLNRDAPIRAVGRAMRFQMGRRLRPAKISVPYADGLEIFIGPGQTAANANYYMGLFELDEQCFFSHLARPGDLFVDIGANVGTFSLLPAVRGANVLAFEPSTETIPHLQDNISLNNLQGLIEIDRRAVTDRQTRLRFTSGRGSTNAVIEDASSDAGQTVVEGVPLDEVLGDRRPLTIKIDVEGHELAVLNGASQTLGAKGPLAVIIEVRRDATEESSETEIRAIMAQNDLEPFGYDPFSRDLVAEHTRPQTKNVIFVRDEAFFITRLRDAQAIRVRDLAI